MVSSSPLSIHLCDDGNVQEEEEEKQWRGGRLRSSISHNTAFWASLLRGRREERGRGKRALLVGEGWKGQDDLGGASPHSLSPPGYSPLHTPLCILLPSLYLFHTGALAFAFHFALLSPSMVRVRDTCQSMPKHAAAAGAAMPAEGGDSHAFFFLQF